MTDLEATAEHVSSMLSTAEKALLVNGADTWSTTPVGRVGLGSVRMSDGPSGVRGTSWDERMLAVSFPCGVALGATFDPDLLATVGDALGREANERGINVLLGPTINLQRSPYGGRHFEYFSEDPYLTAVLATAYIRGLQALGVAASPKHFVANDSETNRHTVNIRLPEDVLREVYLLPFEAAVKDASTWTIMAAYNSVSGTPMTANTEILGTILGDEWGFDGVSLSDWGAVYDTERSAHGPLDLAMPGPNGNWGAPLREAIAAGTVDPAVLDPKVARLVRLAARTGVLDGVPRQALASGASESPSEVARRAAIASITLLDNKRAALPINPATVRRVAIIGPNAVRPVTQGGGSAHVNSRALAGPIEAITRALGPDVEVVTAAGCDTRVRVPSLGDEVASVDPLTGEPGVGVEYCAADGTVLFREVRSGGNLVWFGTLPGGLRPTDVHTVALNARVTADETGEFEIGIAAMSSQLLTRDGAELIDADRSQLEGTDLFHSPFESRVVVTLDAGVPTDFVLRQPLYEKREIAVAFFGMQPVGLDAQTQLDNAVALAESADLAIVIVGTNPEVESEGFDRPTLALPGLQDDLVSRVCAVNASTIVAVNAGAPVSMPWIDEAAAVISTWFGGQWAGDALADVIVGASEPGGRLPFTWPVEDSSPSVRSTQPVAGALDYGTSVEVVNRAYATQSAGVLFPFGHGLGYTDWSVGTVSVDDGGEPFVDFGAGPGSVVRVAVTNIGQRGGSTIVQVYASIDDETIHRGSRKLVGFAKVTAGAGQTVTATIAIPQRVLQHWDVSAQRWVDDTVLGLDVGFSAAGPFVSA